MKILIDTHALVWWLHDDNRLSKRAIAILKNPKNEILVSAAVGWEIAIKVNLGKIHPASLIDELENVVSQEAFLELPITMAHAIQAGVLPLHHRDPFDRLLAAQSKAMDIPILSADVVLDQYAVPRIW